MMMPTQWDSWLVPDFRPWKLDKSGTVQLCSETGNMKWKRIAGLSYV
jgi:hypothetical protein